MYVLESLSGARLFQPLAWPKASTTLFLIFLDIRDKVTIYNSVFSKSVYKNLPMQCLFSIHERSIPSNFIVA